MNIQVTPRVSRNLHKKYYTFEWGKKAGQRKASGIFTYIDPITPTQINHNKEALKILEIKRSQLILEWQGVGTGLIPMHRFCCNFLEFFEAYLRRNKQYSNRHLDSCFKHFKLFIHSNFISPVDITEEFCLRFRKYLLDHLNGESPAGYFARFKHVVRAATKQGYFKENPCQDIHVKANKNKRRKEHLEIEEYLHLLNTPFQNEEVRDAFIFCCYTGLRWCDIKVFTTDFIKNEFTIVQIKTGVEHYISLHPIARSILNKRICWQETARRKKTLFNLPTADGANKLLKEWCNHAGIVKHITWNCARLSFSILLQDARVDVATVALLLGHTSTRYVSEVYKRYRPKNPIAAVTKLPDPTKVPCFYDAHQNLILSTVKVVLPELKPVESVKQEPLESDLFKEVKHKKQTFLARILGLKR